MKSSNAVNKGCYIISYLSELRLNEGTYIHMYLNFHIMKEPCAWKHKENCKWFAKFASKNLWNWKTFWCICPHSSQFMHYNLYIELFLWVRAAEKGMVFKQFSLGYRNQRVLVQNRASFSKSWWIIIIAWRN